MLTKYNSFPQFSFVAFTLFCIYGLTIHAFAPSRRQKSSRGRSNVHGIVGHNLADCPLQATGCLEQSWRCIDLVTKCACCTTFTHSRSTYRVVESAIGVWTSSGAEEKLISASVFCRHWSQCTHELIHNKQPKDASSCPRTNVPNCFTSVRASLHGSLESTTLSAAQKP